jgi:hypothetical protein
MAWRGKSSVVLLEATQTTQLGLLCCLHENNRVKSSTHGKRYTKVIYFYQKNPHQSSFLGFFILKNSTIERF